MQEIDWQDLNGRIVSRSWRTNDVGKDEAEICADIAINEFKKVLKEASSEPKISLQEDNYDAPF